MQDQCKCCACQHLRTQTVECEGETDQCNAPIYDSRADQGGNFPAAWTGEHTRAVNALKEDLCFPCFMNIDNGTKRAWYIRIVLLQENDHGNGILLFLFSYLPRLPGSALQLRYFTSL